MQHSPQEIKTILDRVVDADGNVLDMAAVLDVVTILERLPITKEALEKTRLGKTINLLRKKTTNEELAKRAKGLVKKWQKLVINHLETLRNTDSPINGGRLSSPQINGTIRDSEKPASPSVDRAGKSKILEGKKRGVKRKRNSCSSNENSPNVSMKSDDSESHPGTPNSGQETVLGGQKSSTTSSMSASQPSEEKDCSFSLPQTPQSVEKENNLSLSQESHSHTSQSVDKEHLPSALQITESQSSVDSGIGLQPSVGKIEECSHEYKSTANESELNDCQPGNTNACISQDSQNDLIDTRWNSESPMKDRCHESHSESKVNSNACDAEVKLLQETQVEQETLASPAPTELILDINVEANGVTGRYGGDGTWYDWTEVMPSSDGMLQVLPYVILE